MREWITANLGPALHLVFDPINEFLMDVYMPWARILALALFIGTMIWAWTLRKEYLQVDAPSKSPWADLRVWVVVSMLPHVFVYLFL